jgi:hypothetical protein
MFDLSQISYSSTTYSNDEVGLSRANETLALAIQTAGPEETFDVFHNGRGWVVRMFECGDFVMCV